MDNEFGSKKWLSLSDVIQTELTGSTGSKELAAVLQTIQKQGFDSIPFFYLEEVYDQDIY